jgi:hypothetical protein
VCQQEPARQTLLDIASPIGHRGVRRLHSAHSHGHKKSTKAYRLGRNVWALPLLASYDFAFTA